MMSWTHAGPSKAEAFLASLVKLIEAMTVVLTVGIMGGRRPALLGAACGKRTP
jgi:uncharacterized membrane protein